MMSDKKTLYLYATAATGPSVKIPMQDYINQAYIAQQLLNAGVPMKDLENVSYSTQKPSPTYQLRSSFPSKLEAFAQVSDKKSTDPFPAYPVPSSANSFPAIWSDVKARKFTPLSKLKSEGQQFCMEREGGAKQNLFDYWSSKDFVDQSQWKDLKDGKIGLLYGVAWKQVDAQVIPDGFEYNQKLILSRGMKKQTEYSISTTLGVSYGAVSAELTATFGQVFTITESSIYEESFSLKGKKGEVMVLGIWQLTDMFFLVKKKSSGDYDYLDSYAVTVLDKENQIELNADPLFFGNNEKTASGTSIRTNIYDLTSDVRQHVTTFKTS